MKYKVINKTIQQEKVYYTFCERLQRKYIEICNIAKECFVGSEITIDICDNNKGILGTETFKDYLHINIYKKGKLGEREYTRIYKDIGQLCVMLNFYSIGEYYNYDNIKSFIEKIEHLILRS